MVRTNNERGTKPLFVELAREVHFELKMRAVIEERPMSEIVREAVVGYLRSREEEEGTRG